MLHFRVFNIISFRFLFQTVQTSNLKPFKPQTSNIKSQTSNFSTFKPWITLLLCKLNLKSFQLNDRFFIPVFFVIWLPRILSYFHVRYKVESEGLDWGFIGGLLRFSPRNPQWTLNEPPLNPLCTVTNWWRNEILEPLFLKSRTWLKNCFYRKKTGFVLSLMKLT